MIKTSIEKLAKEIGFDIGHSDDIVQSDLLNGFCESFCQMNSRDKNMQICYMSTKLSDKAKKTILEISEFCKEE